jgi:hypothetical protein
MSTIPLRLRGTVASRGAASALLQTPGDAVIVERGDPRLLVLACPCGCGEVYPVNLDPRSGPAWRLYRRKNVGLSVFPSVWRDTGCRSHYIIWRGEILLFGSDREDRLDVGVEGYGELGSAILDRLGPTFMPFAEIAEHLQAVPWDVLYVCRQLVSEGKAAEGAGKQRGAFCRK